MNSDNTILTFKSKSQFCFVKQNCNTYFSDLPLEIQSKILSETDNYEYLIRNLTSELRKSSTREFYLQSGLRIPLSNKNIIY